MISEINYTSFQNFSFSWLKRSLQILAGSLDELHPLMPFHIYYKFTMQMIPEQEPLFTGPAPETQPEPGVELKPVDEDENLVVATRGTSRVKSSNFKKIFEEVNKQEQSITLPPPIPVPSPQQLARKQPTIKPKISATEKDKRKPDVNLFGRVTQQGMANANNLLDIYRFCTSNRFVADNSQKARAQFKEKVALYLFYGIQELKHSESKLNQFEKSLISRESKSQVDYVKNLINEIQLYIIRHHNKLQKSKIQRGYKDRANLVLVNLRDEANTELRNKILNQKMTTQMLATVRQIDLYTTAKRQQILAKSRSIMAQNTLQVRKNDQEKEMVTETMREQKEEGQASPIKSKYIDQKTTTEVQELITKHIEGFYNKLRTDLPLEEAGFLCSHLDVVFAGR